MRRNFGQKINFFRKSQNDLQNEQYKHDNLTNEQNMAEANNASARRNKEQLGGVKKAIILTIIFTVGTISSINIANNYFKGKANLENVKTQEIMQQDNTDKSQTSDETPQTPEEVKDEAEKQKGGGMTQQEKHKKVVEIIEKEGKGLKNGNKSQGKVQSVITNSEENGGSSNNVTTPESPDKQKQDAVKEAQERANKSDSQVIEGNKGVVIQGEQPAPKTPTPSQDAPTTKSDVQEQQQQQQEAPKKKLGDAIKQREQNQQNNDQQARNQIEMEIE